MRSLPRLAPAVLTLFPAAVHATPVWVNARHITYIYPINTGLMINLDGATINPASGCSPNVLFLPATSANYETMVSALMLAFGQGGSIDIYYENANISNCNPPIYQFIVYK